jgi:TetR/AcrR family transcriptional repressor of uid operon
MSMPRRYRAGIETRRRILESIRSLLADGGLHGATIRAICAQAEIRPGSFYNLFPSKEAAVVTVVRQALEAIDPHPDRRGDDTIEDLIEAYVRFIDERPTLARVYLHAAVTAPTSDGRLTARILRHHQNRIERFSGALKRRRPGLRDSDAARAAELLLAALNGLVLAKIVDPDLDFAAHARSLLSTLEEAGASA